MKSILLWGMGTVYNRNVNLLKYYESLYQIKVIGVTAKETYGLKELDGYRVYDKKDVQTLAVDYIIVMNDRYIENIYQELMELGFDRRQVIHHRVFDIPQFDFNEYIVLKESNISIISNNCWGGIIYNTLNLECLSPFKNLSVGCREYIEILQNIPKYMSYNLNFERFEREPHSHIKYPVMELGGLEIHCNHDTDPDMAKEKWNRRVRKINYDNLFYEMYTDNYEYANKFCNITGCSNKVCFVPFEPQKEGQMQLNRSDMNQEFYEVVNRNAGIATGSLKYNPIKLLLGMDAIRSK